MSPARALLPLLLCCAAAPAGPLDPVAFLAGEFEGEGDHPWGRYRETQRGEWEVGGTVLVVRSKSEMGGRTVFEDLRVFSWDPGRDALSGRP